MSFTVKWTEIMSQKAYCGVRFFAEEISDVSRWKRGSDTQCDHCAEGNCEGARVMKKTKEGLLESVA